MSKNLNEVLVFRSLNSMQFSCYELAGIIKLLLRKARLDKN